MIAPGCYVFVFCFGVFRSLALALTTHFRMVKSLRLAVLFACLLDFFCVVLCCVVGLLKIGHPAASWSCCLKDVYSNNIWCAVGVIGIFWGQSGPLFFGGSRLGDVPHVEVGIVV